MHRHLFAAALAALCVPTAAQTLIAIDSSRELSRIDPVTGVRTFVRTTSSNTVVTASLTYDTLRDRIYLSSTANDRLYRLDVHTGVATLIGSYNDDSVVMHGIEYDASTDTLYGASGGANNNHLYVIDKATGAATQLGNPGFTGYTNLCHDPIANVLYAINADSLSLYTIDRQNGHATLVGPLNGPVNPNGLAMHPTTGVMYLVDNTQQQIYTVDKTTGAATLVGPYGSGNLLGLAWIPHTGTYAPLGPGCAGALGVPTNTALTTANVGTTLSVALQNLPLDAAVFFIGFSSATSPFGALPLDLAPLGAPGCLARVSPDLQTLVLGAPGSATATFAASVPDLPTTLVGVRYYTQAAAFDLGNAFGVVLSDAATGVIGL